MTKADIVAVCIGVLSVFLLIQLPQPKCEDYPATKIGSVLIIGGCQR